MTKMISTSVRNTTGAWEVIDTEPADPGMKNLDGFQVSAHDIGGKVGQPLRVELWDDEGIIDVVEISAS
jgi:hypothetical protein